MFLNASTSKVTITTTTALQPLEKPGEWSVTVKGTQTRAPHCMACDQMLQSGAALTLTGASFLRFETFGDGSARHSGTVSCPHGITMPFVVTYPPGEGEEEGASDGD